MKLNNIDLGTYNPPRLFKVKQMLGDTVVENNGHIYWRRGGEPSAITVKHWVSAPAAIGGAAAASQAANEYLCRWLEEMAGNEDVQPMYIQWSSARSLPQDGWWLLTEANPDYIYTGGGSIPVTMSFVQRAPFGAPLGIYWAGGKLSTAALGAATNLIALPPNSVGVAVSGTRVGGESNIPYLLSPSQDPVTFLGSATYTDLFIGAVHVYDANGTIGTNPVPTGGTFTNANWVEVRGQDHRFVGDIVITNGLLLITIAINGIVTVYFWSTVTGGWFNAGTIQQFDNGSAQGAPTMARLTRIGYEEVNLDLTFTNINATQHRLRLQRGHPILWIGERPLTQANTTPSALRFAPSAGGNLVAYNEAGAYDQGQGAGFLAASTNYYYAAAFIPGAGTQFLFGWLYQNAPARQPDVPVSGLNLGDSAAPVQNAWGFYGLFVVPLANTANQLSAAFGGTLGTGWTSVVDAATARATNAAQCASGTLTGNADTFGTAYSPTGTFDMWVRVRVTSAAGAAAEMQIGLWDATAGAFIASTTLKANQASTSYVWIRVAQAMVLPAAHGTQFRAVTAATLGTNWFVDEAILVPTLLPTNEGPQELWQQWVFERTTTYPIL